MNQLFEGVIVLSKLPAAEYAVSKYEVIRRVELDYKQDERWECMNHERDVLHLNNLWDKNSSFWKIW